MLEDFEIKAEENTSMSLDQSNAFLAAMVEMMRNSFLGEGKIDFEERVTLVLDSSFNFNDSFEQWYNKPDLDTGGFFVDFSDDTISPVHLVKQWNVEYAVVDLDTRGLNKRARARRAAKHIEKHRAKDKGGPSRQFFSDVFTQLQDLCVGEISQEVEKKSRKILLFEDGENCVYPKTDEYVYSKDNKMFHEKSDKYFRAVGRILTHAILSHSGHGKKKGEDVEDGAFDRFSIASHILPGLYRKFLLQGIDPRDMGNYPMTALVDDVVHVLDCKEIQETKDRKQRKAKIMEYLFWADDSHPLTQEELEKFNTMNRKDKEAYFRRMAYENLIATRKRVLENIREGLELGGKTTPVFLAFPYVFG